MSRNVYSWQFIGGTGADTYTWTCPAGYVALLSALDVYTGAILTIQQIQSIGDAGQCFWSTSFDAPGLASASWRGKHVLTAGQTVRITSSAGPFDCSLGGDLLAA